MIMFLITSMEYEVLVSSMMYHTLTFLSFINWMLNIYWSIADMVDDDKKHYGREDFKQKTFYIKWFYSSHPNSQLSTSENHVHSKESSKSLQAAHKYKNCTNCCF